MKVLLIGKGARESALAWKLKHSPDLQQLMVWPSRACPVPGSIVADLPGDAKVETLARFANDQQVDLVICGPEAPLAEGLADECLKLGVACFGVNKAVAQLEADKNFAKQIMSAAGIPTAEFAVAKSEVECRQIATEMLQRTGGTVLKASGLAAGKGVFVCSSLQDIENGLHRLYHTNMSAASQEVVVEEVLRGRECSFFSLIGKSGGQENVATSLGFAVDFKRLQDGDQGPNTGGMGCYTPVPWLPEDATSVVEKVVIEPLMNEITRRNLSFIGTLFVGLMWSDQGPKVIEFNVRFGDPECQVLTTSDFRDWLPMLASKAGLTNVSNITVDSAKSRAAVGVVLASSDYPYGEDKQSVQELPDSVVDQKDSSLVFTASVSRDPKGVLYTGYGRVMTVVGLGESLASARKEAFARVDTIVGSWQSAQFRKDIAEKAETNL